MDLARPCAFWSRFPMGQPRTHTASQERVREQADLALSRETGVSIAFLVARYGSLEACASLSRSFQTSFASLRARDRRLMSKGHFDAKARDTTTQSKYDKLLCIRVPLGEERGWAVDLIQGNMMADAFDVVDYDSREPIDMDKEYTALANKLLELPTLFSREDAERLREIEPNYWDYPMPWEEKAPGQPKGVE